MEYFSGNPLIIEASINVYKIANFDDQENTITMNFLLSTIWHDTRIALESKNDKETLDGWYEVTDIDKVILWSPTLAIGKRKIFSSKFCH